MLSRFDFFFIKRQTIVFSDWGMGGGGAGADFFQQLKLDCFGKSESIFFFCNHKSLPYNNCYQSLYACLKLV